jgi:hypothetical protein
MGFAIPLVKKQSGFQPTIEPTGFQPVVVQYPDSGYPFAGLAVSRRTIMERVP